MSIIPWNNPAFTASYLVLTISTCLPVCYDAVAIETSFKLIKKNQNDEKIENIFDSVINKIW